jgi:hypothetical protein
MDQTCIYMHFFVTNHERYSPKVTYVVLDLFVKAKTKKKEVNHQSVFISNLTLLTNFLAC